MTYNLFLKQGIFSLNKKWHKLILICRMLYYHFIFLLHDIHSLKLILKAVNERMLNYCFMKIAFVQLINFWWESHLQRIETDLLWQLENLLFIALHFFNKLICNCHIFRNSPLTHKSLIKLSLATCPLKFYLNIERRGIVALLANACGILFILNEQYVKKLIKLNL